MRWKDISTSHICRTRREQSRLFTLEWVSFISRLLTKRENGWFFISVLVKDRGHYAYVSPSLNEESELCSSK